MLTSGNVNDATAFGQVLDSVRIPRAVTGRPRTTPARVQGDKAYSSRAMRRLLAAPGHRCHDPRTPRPDGQPPTTWTPRRSPPAFDKDIYRDRNVVERCFARLKQWRIPRSALRRFNGLRRENVL
ncbi:transposase [Streptomyces sp. P5-A9]|uniref:transposase n=1 Tax=Streptomyces sp. P5-A9 TaxID=3071730 RepID=UPI003FCEA158